MDGMAAADNYFVYWIEKQPLLEQIVLAPA